MNPDDAATAKGPGRGAGEPGGLVPYGLERAAAYVWRIVLLAGALYLLVLALASVQVVVLPVIAALLLTALLEPVAAKLRGLGAPDWAAAAVILLTGLAALIVFGLLVVPSVVEQFSDLGANVGQGLGEVRRLLGEILPASTAQTALTQLVGALRAGVGAILGQTVYVAGLVADVALGLFVVLFLVFFFLKDGRRFWGWLQGVVPASRREDLRVLGPQIWTTLQAYLAGVALVGLADAVLIGIALVIIGVPLVAPLMILTFFGAFFPFIGAVAAGLVSALVALVGGGLTDALLVIGVVLIVQQIEGNVLEPLIVGRKVDLHPAVTLIAVTAGGVLAGLVGAFLAVPTAAVTGRVIRYAWSRRVRDPDGAAAAARAAET